MSKAGGAVKLMKTRIRLLASPKSMRSIIDALSESNGTVYLEISAGIEMAFL
jgi:hypothetical protein